MVGHAGLRVVTGMDYSQLRGRGRNILGLPGVSSGFSFLCSRAHGRRNTTIRVVRSTRTVVRRRGNISEVSQRHSAYLPRPALLLHPIV
jgi:hypothetical protein